LHGPPLLLAALKTPGYSSYALKLGEMDDNHGYAPWDDLFVGPLTEPFPFTEAWNDLTDQPDPDGPEDEYEQQLEEFEKLYFRPIEGGFPICHIGCAKRIWLVVTGPEAGNVWQDDRAEDGGVYPMRDAEGRKLTFAAWYMAWLDEALKQLDPAP